MEFDPFDRIDFKGIMDLLEPNMPAQFKLVSYYSKDFKCKQANSTLQSTIDDANYVNHFAKITNSDDALT
jgi:hypothetical protein